jgi:cytochrome bd-type quinol oxidase subunit 2
MKTASVLVAFCLGMFFGSLATGVAISHEPRVERIKPTLDSLPAIPVLPPLPNSHK